MALLIALLLETDMAIHAQWLNMFLLTPWILALLWVLYVVSFASSVRVTDSGIRVQNMLRVSDIPWSQIQGIKMHYQLLIELTNNTTIRCIGGPTAGRPGMLSREESRKQDASVANYQEKVNGGGSARLSSGLKQLASIRQIWQHHRDQGFSDSKETQPVQQSWDKQALIFAAVIGVWLLVSIALVLFGVS